MPFQVCNLDLICLVDRNASSIKEPGIPLAPVQSAKSRPSKHKDVNSCAPYRWKDQKIQYLKCLIPNGIKISGNCLASILHHANSKKSIWVRFPPDCTKKIVFLHKVFSFQQMNPYYSLGNKKKRDEIGCENVIFG